MSNLKPMNRVIGVSNMVFNATFNNISVMAVKFNGGKIQDTRRKPAICHKSLTNFIT